MDLMYVKTRTGEDLIGLILEDKKDSLILDSILSINIDPVNGYLIKEWLFLSKHKSMELHKRDIICYGIASEKAEEYYNRYFDECSKPEPSDDIEEFEHIFSMLEAKNSTKH
jgi:hypothetical protein